MDDHYVVGRLPAQQRRKERCMGLCLLQRFEVAMVRERMWIEPYLFPGNVFAKRNLP